MVSSSARACWSPSRRNRNAVWRTLSIKLNCFLALLLAQRITEQATEKPNVFFERKISIGNFIVTVVGIHSASETVDFLRCLPTAGPVSWLDHAIEGFLLVQGIQLIRRSTSNDNQQDNERRLPTLRQTDYKTASDMRGGFYGIIESRGRYTLVDS